MSTPLEYSSRKSRSVRTITKVAAGLGLMYGLYHACQTEEASDLASANTAFLSLSTSLLYNTYRLALNAWLSDPKPPVVTQPMPQSELFDSLNEETKISIEMHMDLTEGAQLGSELIIDPQVVPLNRFLLEMNSASDNTHDAAIKAAVLELRIALLQQASTLAQQSLSLLAMLMQSRVAGKYRLAQTLLAYIPDINVPVSDGLNALELSIKHGDRTMLELLRSHHAEVTRVNGQFQLLAWALAGNHVKAVSLLMEVIKPEQINWCYEQRTLADIVASCRVETLEPMLLASSARPQGYMVHELFKELMGVVSDYHRHSSYGDTLSENSQKLLLQILEKPTLVEPLFHYYERRLFHVNEPSFRAVLEEFDQLFALLESWNLAAKNQLEPQHHEFIKAFTQLLLKKSGDDIHPGYQSFFLSDHRSGGIRFDHHLQKRFNLFNFEEVRVKFILRLLRIIEPNLPLLEIPLKKPQHPTDRVEVDFSFTQQPHFQLYLKTVLACQLGEVADFFVPDFHKRNQPPVTESISQGLSFGLCALIPAKPLSFLPSNAEKMNVRVSPA